MNELIVNIESSDIEGKNIVSNFKYNFSSENLYVLLGRNGAGKTTLYRMISGLESRYNGTVMLNNDEVKRPSKSIQIVFQDNRFFPWMTLKQNLKFVHPTITELEIQDALGQLNLESKSSSFPKDISGGEESRFSLLLTFLNPPKVLLLDEPFTGLDVYSLRVAIDALEKLRKDNPNTLMILVTHNLLIAKELGNRILILDDETLSINNEISDHEVKTHKELELEYNKWHAT